MIGKKDLFIGFLTGCCVTALLFAMLPTRSASEPVYDPWTDLNDDGVVDSTDLGMLGSAWGSFGPPIAKASLRFDSDWINISDKCGQHITITHNLNRLDVAVEISGKRTADGTPFYMDYGSTTEMQWNQTYGGTNYDQVSSMVQTGDGGYALAGITESFGAGSSDFWLVKTDANGNMQWNQTYGGTDDDYAFSVVQTGDGGYALAGWTASFGAGKEDAWLVKTDANGNMQWNQTYGGTNYDMAYSMVKTGDGGYALAGASISPVGDYDAWLVKTDGSGNMLWNKTYGGTATDVARSLVQTGDGGYALAVETESFGAGSSDFWLVKVDASGNMEWNQTYGGTNHDGAYSLVQTSDGGYALAGHTFSFGAGMADFWLVKTSAESGLAWIDSTANTITLCRGAADPWWNFVRVQIWQVKPTP